MGKFFTKEAKIKPLYKVLGFTTGVGAAGVGLGYANYRSAIMRNPKKYRTIKKRKKLRNEQMLYYGSKGLALGATVGQQMFADDYGQSYRSSGGSYTPPSSRKPTSEDFRNVNINRSQTKKKTQAQTQFRKKVLDLHPDRNPGRDTTKEMQDLNKSWDKIRSSGWYEKLAYLRKLKNLKVLNFSSLSKVII